MKKKSIFHNSEQIFFSAKQHRRRMNSDWRRRNSMRITVEQNLITVIPKNLKNFYLQKKNSMTKVARKYQKENWKIWQKKNTVERILEEHRSRSSFSPTWIEILHLRAKISMKIIFRIIQTKIFYDLFSRPKFSELINVCFRQNFYWFLWIHSEAKDGFLDFLEQTS